MQNYGDTILPTLALIGVIVFIVFLLWALNRFLRRLGGREHHVDRLGNSMLELERMFRPSAEHVITARQERKALEAKDDDNFPERKRP